MRIFTTAVLLGVCIASVALGQNARQDYVWARTSAAPITVDGVLNEPGWAMAESIHVQYGAYNALPGSGWHTENTHPTATLDPTDAWIKFLVSGDSLYIALIAKDSSIGSGPFNRKDGVLMNLRHKSPMGSIATIPANNSHRSFEMFYSWWDLDTTRRALGAKPGYDGWTGGHRDSIQGTDGNLTYHNYTGLTGLVKRLIWDGATTVQGEQNRDTTDAGAPAFDQGYVMEIKLNTSLLGYSPSTGDTIMWSMTIYDADWRWPIDSSKVSGNRVWVQCPWGNAADRGHLNILASPGVDRKSVV